MRMTWVLNSWNHYIDDVIRWDFSGLGHPGVEGSTGMEEWKIVMEAKNPSIIHDGFQISIVVLRPSTRLLIDHDVGGGRGRSTDSSSRSISSL